jgi:methylenetetrahydrofolate reductase (NADPH)
MDNSSVEISFEFFPPQTEKGLENLDRAINDLTVFKPDFFSVTYGAGGSTQEKTFDVVDRIGKSGFNVAPHISCIGATRAEMKSLLDRYLSDGIRRFVTLRGDLPSGMAQTGEFKFASDLVSFIRSEAGSDIEVMVAAYPEYHPQARSPKEDLEHFRHKVSCGANRAITQYFFNADCYFHFVEQAQLVGVDVPIIPGVMPIDKFFQLARFSDSCGAEIPRWVRRKLEAYADDSASIQEFGLEVVTNLCDRLLNGGAPGLHFYTMNKSEKVQAILKNLGIV